LTKQATPKEDAATMPLANSLQHPLRLRRLFGVKTPTPRFENSDAPRLLLYAASNIGLGHLLRVLRIAQRVRQLRPEVNILLLTDNPHLSDLGPELAVPAILLPGFTFDTDSFSETPRSLRKKNSQLRDIRAALIQTTVAAFQPHVFLMDTNPHGKRNELQPALCHLARRSPSTRRVLQMRDIPFPPGENFRLSASPKRITEDSKLYDYLFVAGDSQFFDLATEYNWPDPVKRKLLYLGFITPETEKTQPATRSGSIVASFGGGWEAEPLASKVAQACLRLKEQIGDNLSLDLYPGPALQKEAFHKLENLLVDHPDIRIRQFSADFPQVLARADLAILQAGSTVFQILESPIPIILYARDFKTQEQQYRAARIRQFPNIETIDADWLENNDLDALMRNMLLAERTTRKTRFAYDGVNRAAKSLIQLLDSPNTRPETHGL